MLRPAASRSVWSASGLPALCAREAKARLASENSFHESDCSRDIALRCPLPPSSGRNPDHIGTECGADGAARRPYQRQKLGARSFISAKSLPIILPILLPGLLALSARAQVQYAFTNFAGIPGGPGNVDGTGSAARFWNPYSQVAVDNAGNVYVADTINRTIRKITPTGAVTTLAGSAGQSGSDDGLGSAARFYRPAGVAVDTAGNLYVAESDNATIRKITTAGEVTTLAGSAGQSGSVDGIGSAAQFSGFRAVAVDSAGNLYVADSNNNRITKGTALRPQFDTSNGSLTISNGFFHTRLTGPSGSTVIVEASPNLQSWTPIQTNALPSGVLDLSMPLALNLPALRLRAAARRAELRSGPAPR